MLIYGNLCKFMHSMQTTEFVVSSEEAWAEN